MSTTPQNTQSAAEKKAAEAQIRTLIDKFAPAKLRLIDTVRKELRKRLPTAHEVVYEYAEWFVISFSPSGQGYEGVFAIRVDADGVKLYFNRGKELPDPEKVLEGSGKLVRSIDVESASTLTRPAIVSLIDEAITRNPVPFATAGSGSIVLRSISAKKPQKRRATSKKKRSK